VERAGHERRAIIHRYAGPPFTKTLIHSFAKFLGVLGGSILVVASLGVSAVPNCRKS
jgi:hypothetical protein